MARRLASRLKTARHPRVWWAVAVLCRVAGTASRRRALWWYRYGYAWERAGRLERAGTAFATALRYAPAPGGYRLPAGPAQWDPPAVAFARALTVRGLRQQHGSGVRDLLRRRGRVVPVVPRATRRRWERAATADCAARLHLLYLRHRDAYLPRYLAAAGYRMPRTRLARAWRWFAGDVLVQSVRLLRRNGTGVRAAAGVPLRRQLRELLWLSVTLPSMPENYYRYELYRRRNRVRAASYLHGHENSPVLYEMLAAAEAADTAPLTDKAAFAAFAAARGLPVVPTLAVVAHGRVVAAPATPPRADLFVKPSTGKRGLEVHKWWYDAGLDAYRPAGGDRPAVPRRGFVARLAQDSAGRTLIVQPCLVNHPDLADLALDAVVTCRIVTITDEHGRPEPVIATFRMAAVRGSVVDNMHRGGIAAPVDLASGALGPASGYAIDGPAVRHARHPVSGAPIEGRTLPQWPQVIELVCRAHASFPPRLLVGWDVSIGPDAPVLLEGNERPGVGGLQRLHDLPLGTHRFGELLAHHLTRRFGG